MNSEELRISNEKKKVGGGECMHDNFGPVRD